MRPENGKEKIITTFERSFTFTKGVIEIELLFGISKCKFL